MMSGVTTAPQLRHGKAWPCHPRVSMGDTAPSQANSWIPRPSLGMTANAICAELLRSLHVDARLPLRRRGASSLLVRTRLRRVFRGIRRAAWRLWGVGDDVEIVGDGLHGGSSFC